MPWNPVWFLGQEPRTPRVPYGEDTRIHTYLPILESSIGQCHNYDKSTWHIYDKNDKAICHFLIRLAFVIRCSLARGGTLARTKDGFPPSPRAPLRSTPRLTLKGSGALERNARGMTFLRGKDRTPPRPTPVAGLFSGERAFYCARVA